MSDSEKNADEHHCLIHAYHDDLHEKNRMYLCLCFPLTGKTVRGFSGDGKVSSKDYVRLWNHLDRSNSYTITDENQLKAADISNDQKLTAVDYVKLWNQLLRG